MSPGLRKTMTVDSGCITLNTDSLCLRVRAGRIVTLTNRLSGVSYINGDAGNPPPEFQCGLVYAVPGTAVRASEGSVIGAAPTAAGTKTLVPELIPLTSFADPILRQTGTLRAEYRFARDDGTHATLAFAVETETGDILVGLSASGPRPGLSALRFALPVRFRGDLLIPAFNGMKACRGNAFFNYESSSWEWPSGWQLQWLALQEEGGGLWIHARDTERRFKQMQYHFVGDDQWHVALDVKNFAPFDEKVSIAAFRWRINFYRGDWTTPANTYRCWAHQHYQMRAKKQHRPSWTCDLRLVVRDADHIETEQVLPYLDALAAHTQPEQTLLWMDHWMTSGLNRHTLMPNYGALGAHGLKFYTEAKARGFRMMFYTNHTSITSNHPRFSEFKDHLVRNSYTGAHEGWNLHGEFANWEEVGDIRLYYVNPAYKPWRDFLIEQLAHLCSSHAPDAFFLDQTFLIFNDKNGLIDGMSTIDGNLALHRELAAALPELVLAGEGINELTAQYEGLCSLWFLGVVAEYDAEGNAIGWRQDPAALERMVPLLTHYIDGYTRILGGVDLYGVIPAIEHPTLEALQDAGSAVRRIISAAFGK